MSTVGNKLKEFLEANIQNLDLSNIGGLEFMDNLLENYEASRDVRNDPEDFEAHKLNCGCFEGTYLIHRLRQVVAVTGRFDKFDLFIAIDPNNGIILNVIRGKEKSIFQFAPHAIENLMMTLVELFRK